MEFLRKLAELIHSESCFSYVQTNPINLVKSEQTSNISRTERRVLVEAGHRCAIPTCRHTRVEIAHIVPWSENKVHEFENLIALCPNCHDLYDKDKK